MINDITDLLNQTKKLFNDKDELFLKLHEAIVGIKNGNVDAVFIPGEKGEKGLELNDGDQTYRNFIENMSEGVVTLHADGTIIYSNLSFAKMVNLPIEKVLGKNMRHFIPTAYNEMFERLFDGYPVDHSKVDIISLSINGIETHFIVSLNKLKIHDIIALNLVWTDVTIQKQTEAALITANHACKNAVEDLKLAQKTITLLNNTLKENIHTLEDKNIKQSSFAQIAAINLEESLRKILEYNTILMEEFNKIIHEKEQNQFNKMRVASKAICNLVHNILENSLLSHNDPFL